MSAARIAAAVFLLILALIMVPSLWDQLDGLRNRAQGACVHQGHWFDRASPDWEADSPDIVAFEQAEDCGAARAAALYLPNGVELPADAEVAWHGPVLPEPVTRTLVPVIAGLPLLILASLAAVATDRRV